MPTGQSTPRINRSVVIIVFVCLITRIVFFGFVHPWTADKEENVVLQSDAWGYHMLARNILEHGSFSIEMDQVPNSSRTPLYPGFVAAVYAVFGYKPWVAICVQMVLDALACLLLFLTLFRLFDYRVGLIAAFFYAIDPMLILYSSATLLSDSLFVGLVVVAFYWFSRGFKADSSGKTVVYYGVCGFFMGLATLCRPISQYLPVVFIVFLLVWYRKQWREGLRYAVVFMVIFAVTLLPWYIRNYKTFGHFVFSSASYQNMLVGYVAPMEMIRRNQSFNEVKASLLEEAEQRMIADGLDPETMDGWEKGKYYRPLAMSYIKRDPVLFGKTYLYGVMYLFTSLNTTVFSEKLGITMPEANIKGTHNVIDLVKNFIAKKGVAGVVMALVIAPLFLVAYLGAVLGFFVSWKKYNRYIIVLCAVIIVYFAALTGVKGMARFKLPAIPFYLAFTGIGLSYLRDRFLRH